MNESALINRSASIGPNAVMGTDSRLGFNPSAIRVAILRSKFWVIGIVGVALLFGVLYSLLATQLYSATATVQVDQDSEKILGTENTDAAAAIMDADRFLQTQLDILKSESLRDAVAKEFGFYRRSELFFEMMEVSPDLVERSFISKDQAVRERVLEILSKNLDVRLPPDSRIISITFTSPDSGFSAKIANSFAKNYIRSNLRRKFDSSSYARDFLKQQLDEARIRLEESERDQLAYAKSRRLIDPSNATEINGLREAPKSLTAATLIQLNQSHAEAIATRLAAEKRWQAIQSSPILNSPDVLANETIQRLLQTKAQMEASLQEQRERRKDDYPAVRQLAAQVTELDRQIKEIGSSIRQSVRKNYQSSLAVEGAIKDQIEILEERTLEEQGRSVELGILARQTQTDRELFGALLKRYNELTAEAGVRANNIVLVDEGRVSSDPVSPNVPLNMVAAALLGIMVAGAFVTGRELLFDTIRTPDDVRDRLGFGVIGVIPNVGSFDDLQSSEFMDAKSEVSEAFSTLRAALALSSPTGVPKSIHLTSTRASEGKSFVTLCTAISIARLGRRVVLLDLDLRRPNQQALSHLSNVMGASNWLSGGASVADLVHKDVYPGVDIITSGKIPPNPTELLSSGRLPELIEALEASYDVVLVDGPPVLGLADSLLISSACQASVMVIFSAGNPTSAVRNSMTRLEQGGANLVGVVLNRFDSKQSGYAYEYSYGYGSDRSESER